MRYLIDYKNEGGFTSCIVKPIDSAGLVIAESGYKEFDNPKDMFAFYGVESTFVKHG